MQILKGPYCTCISVVILVSMKQSQNIEEAHAGKHMHLCEEKNKKE